MLDDSNGILSMDDLRQLTERRSGDRRQGMSVGLHHISQGLSMIVQDALMPYSGVVLSDATVTQLRHDAIVLQRMADVLDGEDDRRGDRRG